MDRTGVATRAAPQAQAAYSDRDDLAATLRTQRRRETDAVRVLFETSLDALFVIRIGASGNFHLEEFNPAFARLFGVGSGSHRGALHQLLPGAIADRFTKALLRCHRSGMPARVNLSLSAQGRIAQWEFVLTPVAGLLGRLERIIGHGRVRQGDPPHAVGGDVLEGIARTTRDLFYVFDRSMKHSLFLNARVNDVLGYAVDEIGDMTRDGLRALIHPDDLPRVIAHYRKLDELPPGAPMSIEYRVRHANGRYIWLASKDVVVASGPGGRTRKTVGCATDISDHRHALAEVKKITRQLLRTQEEERRRIARELHDSTCQHLVAAGIGLTRLGMISEREPVARMDHEDVREILADMRKCIAEAQSEIRALSYLLHPPALHSMGLGETLRRFAAGYSRRTKIRVELGIEEGLVCRSYDVATALLRIAQEALVNVYRHSGATRVAIKLMTNEDGLRLEIEDDGKGIGRPHAADLADIETIGVGIPGMRARVRQFGGELEVLSREAGVLVRATIPHGALNLDQA